MQIVLNYVDEFLPQEPELYRIAQYGWDRHNHTYQHLKRCKPQYPVDSQHPAKYAKPICHHKGLCKGDNNIDRHHEIRGLY